MKEEEIQRIANHLEGVIDRKVNGKIDKLREEIRPILEAYTSAGNFGNFVVWISKIVIAIGVIVAAIIGITKLK